MCVYLGTTNTNALDDILGLNLGPSLPQSTTLMANNSINLLDSLAGDGPAVGGPLFGGSYPAAAPVTGGGGLDSLLNGVDTLSFAAPSSTVPPLTAYEKHGLRVVFTFPQTIAGGRCFYFAYN